MMSATSDCRPTDLEYRLERWIEQRTGGRVHRLRVDRVEDRSVVQGHTGSYYVRQLALAAVMEILDSCNGGAGPVEIDIQVGRERTGVGTPAESLRHDQPILVKRIATSQSPSEILEGSNTWLKSDWMFA